MKFRNEIRINADIDTAWNTFIDPDNLRHWQPTLKSVTLKSGTATEPGAVSELVFDEDGRQVVMTQTITEKRAPDLLAGEYDSAWSRVVVVNHFQAIADGSTRWTVYSRHRFKGMMKIMALFIRRAIRERNDDWLQRFKLLVESRAAEQSS
jgi:uncharacterized protein YndB with AHSA1/START domain